MTSSCIDACIICDIDGFTGRHESTVVGSLPADFCTFTVHNAQWIAFIAGSEDLAVELSVSNCEGGLGLEFALYQSLDCNTFQMISNCFGGVTGTVGPGQSKVIENNEPLVIGQYYYIAMDGAIGDNCDWTFSVLEGSTAVSPLTETAPIEGPRSTCPEVATTYRLPPRAGATQFAWTLDGTPLGSTADSVLIDWPGPGQYTLCATAANACEEALPTCIDVTVAGLPATALVPVICAGDTYLLPNGESTDVAGNYTFGLVGTAGCDSLVDVALMVLPAAFTPLDLRICQGDTLYLGHEPYFGAGTFTQLFATSNGCDSTVELTLAVIECDVQASGEPEGTSCAGATDGTLRFTVDNGTPPFTYTYQNLTASVASGGTTDLGTETVVDNLPLGTYLISLADNFGNEAILIQVIDSPPPLLGNLFSSNYGSFQVSCAGANDGQLGVEVEGGTPPYTYGWSTGATTGRLDSLTAGNYALTLTDAQACSLVLTATLNAPAPLELLATGTDPDCSGPTTGRLGAAATGGLAPYRFDLGTGTPGPNTQRTGLGSGTYALRLVDANGCTADTALTLTAPIYPVLEHSSELTLALGDSVRLTPTSNLDPASLRWRSAAYLSCADCARPVARPFLTSTYTLFGTSPDGCTDSLEVLIRVIPDRDLYVPTAFSPNGDGVNDRFHPYPDGGVARIVSLQVFNRWGGAVYRADNIDPQQAGTFGWDGTYRGQTAAIGVYAWSAEVLYLDGQIVPYGGSVVLLR